MNHLSKRIFSLCMALVMLVMLIPQAAFAAPDTDPDFSVEYHAWVTDYATNGVKDGYHTDVINTDKSGEGAGGVLPDNKKAQANTLPTKTIYFETNGEIRTTTVLSEIFKSRDDFSYYTAPGLHYIDQVTHFNGNYLLKEIWLADSASGPWTVWTTASAPSNTGWTVSNKFTGIADLSKVQFSNDTSLVCAADRLVLKEGSVIRLVYDTTIGNHDFSTKVFDYDISDGNVRTMTYTAKDGKTKFNVPTLTDTYLAGINSHNTVLGFGNANTGSGMDSKTLADGTKLNQAAKLGTGPSYQQGAYGITNKIGLTAAGLPNFTVSAPDLFSDNAITGKTVVPGNHTLTFANEGDLYVINKATIADKDGTPAISANLGQLQKNPDYPSIWSNNFFPLDDLSEVPGVDPMFGQRQAKVSYRSGGYTRTEHITEYGYAKDDTNKVTATLPVSDDMANAHNCYFGLTYDVDFTLDADYIGPMNYLFFGDDDLWLYLIKDGDYANAQLVCDIGGVHSAIGEYVDLWDYIEGGRADHDTAEYTLRFFYSERGASGSTFYMSFVLPQVHPITPIDERGSLEVEKEVKDVTTDESFDFQIKLSGSDKLANEVYSAAVYETKNANPTYIIFNGADTLNVQLKHTGKVIIDNLPAGTAYTVTETANGDYVTTKTGDTGTIKVNETATAKFVNTYREGALTVSKKVVGAMAEDGKEFRFTVKLSDTTINGQYGEMNFVDGEATFTLKDGESVTATDLPADITYTVTEAAETLYDTTSTGATGAIEDDKTAVAAFTNTFNAGELKVGKIVTGTNIDKNKEFLFTVTLSDTTINGQYGDMIFTDGVASFTLKYGEVITAANLPDGITYTVVETADDDYTTTYTDQTGTIEANETAFAVVTNDVREGDLTVTKTVQGESANYQKAFEFTVTLSEPINGQYGDMFFVDGVATFTLSHGQSASALALPADVTYVVTETPDEDYTTSSTGAEGVIEDEESKIAEFLNVYREGDLTVTKTVTGEWADYDKAFEFTVTLSEAVSGTFGDMTFVDGVATFTLKNGETVTALNLPADVTYTVTEAEYDEYLTTSVDATGTIVDGETAEAVFNNHYNLGSLIVTKTVEGESADYQLPFQFTVTLSDTTINGVYGDVEFVNGVAVFTLSHGQSAEIVGLPDGVEYTVVETADEDYITTSTGETGVIEDSTTAETKFLNIYREGDLTVTKTVTGEWADYEKAFEFTVTLSEAVSGTFGDMTFVDGVATFTLKNGESATALNLPADVTYTVTEAVYDEYLTTSTGETGVIEHNKTAVAAFNNHYNLGNLIVSKTVTGEWGDKNKEFQFTIVLSEVISGTFGDVEFVSGIAAFTLKDGESVNVTGLPADVTYTVIEDSYVEYLTTSTGETGIIEDSKTAEAVFTNHYNVGNLVITKTVEGESADYAKGFEFTVTLSDTTINGVYGDVEFVDGVAVFALAHGESATIVGLPNGVEYTVVETADEDYITTYTGATGVIEDSVIKTAEFLNVYREGDLTVTKTVTGEWADLEKEFTFTITLSEAVSGTFGDMTFVDGVATFTLKNGETATALNLPADVTYTVTEAEYNEYLTTSTGETGIIVDGETAEAAFNNHYNLGNLVITKAVTGEWADLEKEFAFTVTLSDAAINGVYGDVEFVNGVAQFTLANGESVAIVGLPAGVEYTVAEEAYAEYLTTSVGEIGTIEASVIKRADFTNHYNVGDLEVYKLVIGQSGDVNKDFTFTVTLSDTTINGVYGDMTFVDGVATFTLKHDETAKAIGLPDGVTYTVTEAADEDYTTTFTGETGTITASTTARAEFTNDYREGELTVTKTVTGDEKDPEKPFLFTVTLSEPINGWFGGMFFTDGVATFTLIDGESITATGLPADAAYTVVESEYEDYFPSVNGVEGNEFSGVIDDDGKDTVDYVNHIASDAIVELEVLKTVDGLVPGDMLFDFILVDEEMNILQIAQNDADGVVTFDPLVFDAEGTYLYAIFENIVDDPAMDFDQSIYVVAVNVTLEENYEAEVIILKNEELYEGEMIFENKTVELTDLTVTKIWSGDGGNHQPDSILVQLYCNGEAFGEPVELNDANEWTYTWTDLRAEGNIWEVDEVEVPESYHKTVVYDQETDQWIITNEYVPETGDSTPVALLTAAMVLSLLGICAIVVLRRKRT